MSDVVTSYKVRLFFEVEKQKAALDFFSNVGRGARDADKNAASLGDTLKGVARLAAGAFGLHEAKKSFIDFNSNLEQAKLTMAGLVSSMKGGTLQDSLKDANTLVDQLQRRSKSTVLTTEELVHMAQSITEPVLQAGGGMKDLEDFTVGAGVAAKALGSNADYAALEITEALQGNWTKRARFMNMLMGPTGMKSEEFNKMSAGQRFQAVSGALNAPWLKQLAEAQRNSFEGVTSTLKDNIQIALGKIGLPLFKAITKEIGSWNEWFNNHPKELAAFVSSISSMLVGTFGVVKDVLKFIWQNRELLKLLAEAALVSKGIGAVGGLVSGGFKYMGAFADKLGGLTMATEKAAEAEMSFGDKLAAGGAKVTLGLQSLLGGFALGMGLVATYEHQKDAEEQAKMEMSVVRGGTNVFAGEYGGLFGGAKYQQGATPFGPRARVQMSDELSGMMGIYRKHGMLDQYGNLDTSKLPEAAEGDLNGGKKLFTDTMGAPQVVSFNEGLKYRRSLGDIGGLKDKAYGEGGGANIAAYKFAAEFDERFAKEIELMDKMQIVLSADADRRMQDWETMMAKLGITLDDALDPVAVGRKLWSGVLDAAKAKNAAREHGQGGPKPNKSDVHVHIAKMEVVADDADRVVIGMMSLAEDALRNPSTAAGVYRDR